MRQIIVTRHIFIISIFIVQTLLTTVEFKTQNRPAMHDGILTIGKWANCSAECQRDIFKYTLKKILPYQSAFFS